MNSADSKTASHTPGPWHVDFASYNGPYICTPHAERGIARVVFGDSSVANARLIAAAPDLLEALALYVAICGNTAHSVTRESAQQAHAKATAAIEKALGKPSATPSEGAPQQ